MSKIHIVFEESAAVALSKSFELDGQLQGDLLVVKDDLSLGPIQHIYESDGFQTRKLWWEWVLQYSPYLEQNIMSEDRLAVHQLKKRLQQDVDLDVYIWMGQNTHDVCGYFWLITQLVDFQGRIYIVYLNNLPFINEEGGIFYPTHLFEIAPREFVKAQKLARLVSSSEFELDTDDWGKLCDENGAIRFLEGGKKIVTKDVAYYDTKIFNALGTKSMRLTKLISILQSKELSGVSDVYIVWRIRKMTEAGRVLCEGNWEKGWKDILVKDTKGQLFVEIEKDED